MPIEAQLPDGTILEFPDDTPDAVVQAKVREYLGAAHTPAPSAPPTERSAVSRLFAPAVQAITGLAALPGAAVDAAKMIGQGRYGEMTSSLGNALIRPQVEQARGVGEAAQRGDYGEAALRVAAVADVGGVGADIGESISEGDIAGALGKGVVAAAPFARAPKFLLPSAVSQLLRRRAAARILAAERPGPKFVEKAVEAANEVLEGTPSLDPGARLPGIGVGTLDTMVKRSRAARKVAGQERGALETIDIPINPARAVEGLRAEAAGLETVVPEARVVTRRKPSGGGRPVMRVMPERVTSKDPALTAALRTHASQLERDASQFAAAGTPGIPAGELFKQQRVIGKVAGKAYRTEPGTEAATAAAAGRAYREQVGRLLKEELEPQGIPVGDINRAYEVWNNAAINFRKARRASLSEQGWAGLKDLLAGRLLGNIARAAGGATVGGIVGGPAAGITGALVGVALGRSTFWNTMRATTYTRLAQLLNAGRVDEAAQLLTSAEAAFAVEQGIRDRERHRKAEKALRAQADGVVEP
jgi:hypothetical protein